MRVVAEGFALTLYLGMPITFWDAAWLASSADTPLARDAFLRLYHAEIGTIEIDGLPVDAIVPIDGFQAWWLEIFVWVFLPGAACLDGCEQSQRPSL